MADYGEPWRLHAPQAVDLESRVDDGNGHPVGLIRSHIAPRVVACVNACAGADDPQQGELARLRKHALRPMSEAPRDGSWIIVLWTEVDPPATKPVHWDTGYSIHGLGGCWTGEGGTYGDSHFSGWLDGWMIGELIKQRDDAEARALERRRRWRRHIRRDLQRNLHETEIRTSGIRSPPQSAP